MLGKIVLSGFATALLFGAIPAQAGLATNSISMNGLASNGRSIQGVDLNGTTLNGTRINGTDLDTAARPRVIAVELPESMR